jgi:type IV pilus assembly protein PilN
MLINLLPYREASLAVQRQAFARYLLLAGLLALAVAAGWSAVLEQALTDPTEASQQLRQEIKQLDAHIKRMDALQADIKALALREAALQQLQDERRQPADWLPQLMHVPDGLHLTAVKQDNLGVHVQGAARASAQVFDWVRQLARQTQGLQRPELIDVSAPLPSPAAPLPAGVVFSLRAQSRAAPASAGPVGPQTGGAP